MELSLLIMPSSMEAFRIENKTDDDSFDLHRALLLSSFKSPCCFVSFIGAGRIPAIRIPAWDSSRFGIAPPPSLTRCFEPYSGLPVELI